MRIPLQAFIVMCCTLCSASVALSQSQLQLESNGIAGYVEQTADGEFTVLEDPNPACSGFLSGSGCTTKNIRYKGSAKTRENAKRQCANAQQARDLLSCNENTECFDNEGPGICLDADGKADTTFYYYPNSNTFLCIWTCIYACHNSLQPGDPVGAE